MNMHQEGTTQNVKQQIHWTLMDKWNGKSKLWVIRNL